VRRLTSQLLLLVLLAACQRREALTATKAEEILRANMPGTEPVYAEVPQRVWWDAKAPKDDFDDKSVRTLMLLQSAGLIAVSGGPTAEGADYRAKVTPKGFPLLGTAPSYRGPVFRGMICRKVYDGIRNFQRHPTEPTVGHAELVWHYADPTPLYTLFETKINKPLNTPFVSLVSFYYKDYQWRYDVTVRKTEG
jgi:hypothetical protein